MNFDDLVRKESLKKVSQIDWQMVSRLIKRAKKDLKTAKKNLNDDEPTALDLVYN